MDLTLLRSLLIVLLESLVLLAGLWLVWRAVDWIDGRLQARLDRSEAATAPTTAPTLGPEPEGGQRPVPWLRYAAGLVSRLLMLAALFLSAALVFAWLTSVLVAFELTRPVGERLGGLFLDAARTVGNGLLGAVPGVIVVVVIALIAQAAVEASNAMFRAVSQRQLRLRALHPETAGATRRLVALGIWALAVVAAWPYVPGSSSDVFKGLSVLVGAMVTLGSSGIVNQLMSGLVLVYSRALRVGDHVVVGETEGVVNEIGTLATKLVTMRNEEITIPNAVLVSSPIKNYSRLSERNGTLVSTQVTIGYDVPWRDVHALLLRAAERTEGLRREPVPFVLQRALSDFYVAYELFGYLDRPIERIPMLSRLHGHIQDCFNEAGVQIMSPHFMDQPAQPVVARTP